MIGIDLTLITRIKKAIANDSFKTRVFTEAEQSYCDGKADKAQSYAGLFCAKEAAAKALKVGFGNGMMPTDIEVTHDALGAPKITAHGRALELLGGRAIDLSISHDGDYAIAVVEILGEKYPNV